MKNSKIRILLLLFISSLLLESKPNFSKCIFGKCYKKDSKVLAKNSFSRVKVALYKILDKDSTKLDRALSNILVAQDSINNDINESLNYEIESEVQYFENDIFFSEGNVIVSLPNGILKADKISYDKSKKIFKAESNVVFEKGNQYFKSDYIEYDFIKYKGHIINIFGILDFESINNDLALINAQLEEKTCKNKTLDLNDLPTEIELLSSTNERYKGSVGLNKIKYNVSSILNWRFKSERIDLFKNKWKSDLITFTNDPYNKPQLFFNSRDFLGEVIDGKTKLSSGSTTVNFDSKVTLPIIGNRTIGAESSDLRWGIGYDDKDKDGFFLIRNFDPLNLNENLSIDFQPYFLIQRAIEGKSDSFRKKDSKVLSENFQKDIKVNDYFAINSKIKGKVKKWDLDINLDSKTFNPSNFYDAFSGDLNLLRNIYVLSRSKDYKSEDSCNNVSTFGDIYEKYSVDLGFYSVFNKDDLYTSFGSKLVGNYKFRKENFNKDYSLVFDLGNYQGSNLKSEYDLVKLTRYGISSSLSHKYKLSDINKKSKKYSAEFKYFPEIVDQGLFINAKLGLGLFEYSNDKSQSLFSLSIGPSLTYGNLKKNFFDYSRISIFPEFVIKNGESPFKFDDFNNDSRVRFDLKQQLYGPLLIGLQGDYDINTNSSSYASIKNKRISLEISRRAYSLALSYLEDDKSLFFGFEIFNFENRKFKQDF